LSQNARFASTIDVALELHWLKEIELLICHFSSWIGQDKWLPTLRTLVAKINETFGHNFKEMAVAGEVSLGELPLSRALLPVIQQQFHLVISQLKVLN